MRPPPPPPPTVVQTFRQHAHYELCLGSAADPYRPAAGAQSQRALRDGCHLQVRYCHSWNPPMLEPCTLPTVTASRGLRASLQHAGHAGCVGQRALGSRQHVCHLSGALPTVSHLALAQAHVRLMIVHNSSRRIHLCELNLTCYSQHSDMPDAKREATLAAFLARVADQRTWQQPVSPARRPALSGGVQLPGKQVLSLRYPDDTSCSWAAWLQGFLSQPAARSWRGIAGMTQEMAICQMTPVSLHQGPLIACRLLGPRSHVVIFAEMHPTTSLREKLPSCLTALGCILVNPSVGG